MIDGLGGITKSIIKNILKDKKMSTMKEFMDSEETKGLLIHIRETYNNKFPDTAISEETLDVSIEVFDHICKNYRKLEGTAAAGNYIASCLATYMMLFNQVSDDVVTLDL